MTWRVEFLNETVQAELEILPLDIRASFLRISRLIAAEGLQRVREPYVKHLDGPLWEMRMKGKEMASPVRLTSRRRANASWWCGCSRRKRRRPRVVR